MKKIALIILIALVSGLSAVAQEAVCFRKLLDNGILIVNEDAKISSSKQSKLELAIQYKNEGNVPEYRMLLNIGTGDPDLSIPQGAKLKVKTASGKVFDFINTIDAHYPYEGQLLYWVKRAIYQKKFGNTKGNTVWKSLSESYYYLYSRMYDFIDPNDKKGHTPKDYCGVVEACEKSISGWGIQTKIRGSYLLNDEILKCLTEEGIIAIRLQTSKDNYDWTFNEIEAKKIASIISGQLTTIERNIDPFKSFGKSMPKKEMTVAVAPAIQEDFELETAISVMDLSGEWESEETESADGRTKTKYHYSFRSSTFEEQRAAGSDSGIVNVSMLVRSTYDIKDASIAEKCQYQYSGKYQYQDGNLKVDWDTESVTAELLEFNPFRAKLSEKQKKEFVESMKKQLPEKKAEAMSNALQISNESQAKNHSSQIKGVNDNTIVIIDESQSGEKVAYKFHRITR